jgi:galactose mutarotase-like enzyme
VTRIKSWLLTDAANDVWVDSFAVANDRLRLATPHPWSVHKRTLRGGLRDGIDLVEVHNGALSYSLLPTRGMGLWRGDYRGIPVGWRSPVPGPVHPKYVNLPDRGGLGWLAGFDELMCRCGLSSNGAPGEDVVTDKQGRTSRSQLPLHGRIANLPAQVVEVRVHLDPPFELSVTGVVEEAALFFPHLRLTATYTTVPGSNRVTVHDVVENRSAQPAELEALYHTNLGPPFLEAGSRVVVPLREVAPRDARAAEGADTFDTYPGPTVGFAEQVFFYDPLADAAGRTLALLYNAAADRGVAVRFNRNELPCLTVWKNPGAVEDGYVTGLEPATNYPNLKTFERQQGRVRVLPPGGRWECKWSLEVLDSRDAVGHALAEVAALQAHGKATVHRTPQPRLSPG